VTISGKSSYTVGDLAAACGCTVETVRYYEKTALMPDPPRTEGGHRIYSLELLKRLTFIRRSRDLGFSIDQISELLCFVDEPGHSCGEVKGMALLHARDIQSKIDDLNRLQKALNEMAAHCKGGRYQVEDCPIIDALFESEGPSHK
jgi:MerR family transcriptional regulator, mercuric resistance operon regulatory protein